MTDLDLLDLLPVLMAHLPARLHAQFYDAFGIEILYRHDLRQVTIHATLTASTLAALIRHSDNPPPGHRTFGFGTQPWDTGNPA